ncbi:sulfite exporter TauE/SafE family protein [Streptomyces sp. NPDC049954]|uniref:sulfite exporter TauE/SafE family protein n=1 Tax=Streptomyces sp. NPDC049954 TaxID=3155779 RepID=UPI003430B378
MELVVLMGAVACVFTLGAAAQAVTGFGCALVTVPLLAPLIGSPRAVIVTVAVSCAISALGWWRERDHVVGAKARRLSIAGIAGMPLGIIALTYGGPRSLTFLIAAVALLVVFALTGRVRLPTGPRAEIGAGIIAGALETSVGMNGPPIVLTLQGSGLTPKALRSTLQAVFCTQGAVALTALTALGHADAACLPLVLAGLVGMPLGWRLGDIAFSRLSAGMSRRAVTVGLAFSAAASLLGVLW